MKLQELAEVMIGIVVKREKKEDGENTYPLFSLKNYEENQVYDEIKTNKDLSNKLVKEGDLLFRLLYPNKIIYVDKELEGMLIPSQFCIIRTEKEKIDPIILKWYLESEEMEEERKLKITGSIIQSMPVSALKTIEIPEISIQEQQNMKKLILLWEEEKNISKQILEKKEKLYNHYLKKMIKRGDYYVNN